MMAFLSRETPGIESGYHLQEGDRRPATGDNPAT